MTKKEANELIKYLNNAYFYGNLDKMDKNQLEDYVKIFYEMFIRFDKKLVKTAISKIIQSSKFFPNFAELNINVSESLFNRQYEIITRLIDNKYFEKDMTGTKREIEKKAFDRFDKILVEMIINEYTKETIDEIKYAVENVDYLKEFKGLTLFDNELPNPPGCDPNYNYNYSTPTAHLYSHK